MGIVKVREAYRTISTGQLRALLRLPLPAYRRGGLPRFSGRPGLEVGFPLRCFQRLSRPYIATRHCGWRHNRSTRGTSIPVPFFPRERDPTTSLPPPPPKKTSKTPTERSHTL